MFGGVVMTEEIMDRDELMDALTVALIDRKGAADALEAASQKLYAADHAVQDLIDQLQPRIELTRASLFVPQRLPETPQTPSERVHAALVNTDRRLNPAEIVHLTGLSRKQVGPCLGSLVKRGLVRNAGNGTWTAA